MAATVEERLAELEARLTTVEDHVRRSRRPWIGVTIEEAKARASFPAERGPEQMELLRQATGSFLDGPEDLSERMRDYINGERR